MSLVIISTHPIQYHAPVYRALQQEFGIPVTVIYGSDFSVVGYHDQEFDTTFAWDTDLLSGYAPVFLSRVSDGGARSVEEVSTRGLEKTLRNIKPRAVMVTGYSPRFHQMAFYEALKVKCPILFRGETTDHIHKRNFLKTWLRDRALSWMYQRCAKLLYMGQSSFQHFRRLDCPEEKMIFSPYCVDTTPFQCDDESRAHLRSLTRQKFSIKESDIAILFSGKLILGKGPDMVLKGIKKLPPETREQIVAVFLGNGKLRDDLKAFTQKYPRIRNRFIGFKNQSEISRYYHAADLLVLPSRAEKWGLVVNEALHHGLPCVVSEAVGCLPDLIQQGVTGEIFRTDSASDLALSILRALRLINNAGIRERCRKRMDNYTVKNAANGIKNAYEAVKNEKR